MVRDQYLPHPPPPPPTTELYGLFFCPLLIAEIPSRSGGRFPHSLNEVAPFRRGSETLESRHLATAIGTVDTNYTSWHLKLLCFWLLLIAIFVTLLTYSPARVVLEGALVGPPLRYCRQFFVPSLEKKKCLFQVFLIKYTLYLKHNSLSH
jgi:hypothetical protein